MKKIISFILIIISSISIVSAKSINDLYNELNSLETKKNLYNYLTSDEINNILSASLDIEIVIDTLNDEINDINKNIEAKEKNIDKLNEEVNNYLVFNQITEGENIYLEYIFSSEDYTDMIYRYMVVERLTNYNNNLIEKLNKEQLDTAEINVLGSIENSESIVSTCKKELEKDDLPEEQKELLIHTIEDHTYQINSSKEIIKLIQSLKVKERNKNAKK